MAADIFFDAKGTEYLASRRAGHVALNSYFRFYRHLGHDIRFHN
jgi:hypothetical protein